MQNRQNNLEIKIIINLQFKLNGFEDPLNLF